MGALLAVKRGGGVVYMLLTLKCRTVVNIPGWSQSPIFFFVNSMTLAQQIYSCGFGRPFTLST